MIKLDNPPYIQLAMDIPYVKEVKTVLSKIINGFPNLLVEIGTPLIKNEGLKSIVPIFRSYFPNNYLIADLKTLDVGELEVELVAQTSANACVVSGLAPIPTIEVFIKSCHENNLQAWVDSLGIEIDDFKKKLKQLNSLQPDVLILHRGIDQEIAGQKSSWNLIQQIKEISNSLIASAGGITLQNCILPYRAGADIIIVGRAIYQAENPNFEISNFFTKLSEKKSEKL